MTSICEDRMCAGCMACVDICPTGAVTVDPGIDFYRPAIDRGKCVDCGRCTQVCQQRNPAESKEPVAWYQGWALDPAVRAASSSGGFATAISRSFVSSGGAVCACAFSGGRFGFEIVEDLDGVNCFRGSKYVKSDPSGAYGQVRALLRAERKVLFIGLPCQVSAMRNFVGEKLQNNLYTIDLICHGTPSPQLLEAFLKECGSSLSAIRDITFRRKSNLYDGGIGTMVDELGVIDRYLIAFLNSLDYTENCYFCTYAGMERVSDLTLGDSWGSELQDEIGSGISLALCQTEKGEALLHDSELKLLPVDVERAVFYNSQLRESPRRSKERDRFLRALAAGETFERSVAYSLPKQCLRQGIKRTLLGIGVMKPSESGYQTTLFSFDEPGVSFASECVGDDAQTGRR